MIGMRYSLSRPWQVVKAVRVELELRNLPGFRIMEYLAEAGGEPTGELAVSGDGWSAYLEPIEPAVVGAVQIPSDRLVISGHDSAVERISAFMRRKTMRGGG
jgi:hypothetical protein